MRKIQVNAAAGKENVKYQTVKKESGTTRAPIRAHPFKTIQIIINILN